MNKITPTLTLFQAQICIDALDLYAEGSMGQLTQREIREARAVRRKLSAAFTTGEKEAG